MKGMDPILIEVEGQDFIVHFQNNGSPDFNMRWSGQAIEIHKYTDGSWKYRSNTSSDSVEKKEEARVWFDWTFCWRGVWEGRVYFKDDEYWSEEMATIPVLWDKIEVIIKDRIKADNPEYGYFD